MNLKPKALRRLLVLGGLFVSVVVLTLALVFVRSWQNQRRADRLRADGMAALAAADYPVVLDNLAGYLRRKPKDREAWLAFAQAREKVEEAEGKHLPQAAMAYSRALALDPADTATARTLLRIFSDLGYSVEARDLAKSLRPANPADATAEHAEVLMDEATARLSLKEFGEKDLDLVTARALALAPDNPRAAYLRAEFLRGAGRKDDCVALAQSLPAAHPDDPRFELACLMILESTADAGEARLDRRKAFAAGLARIAGLKVGEDGFPIAQLERAPVYTDAEFGLRLAAALESSVMPGPALVVLRDAAIRLKNPSARQAAARRQWQYGLTQDLLADYPNPDVGPTGEHSETLAFLAMAARELGQKELADRLTAALKARPRHYAARAWTLALEALATEDPKERLAKLDLAIREDPPEPVLHCQRGDTLRALGRLDEARQAWATAASSTIARTWSTPLARTAESFLDEGRLDEGLAAANNAQQRNPGSATALLVYLRALTESILAGRAPQDSGELLDYLKRITATFEGSAGTAAVERLIIPARAALLASRGRTTDAAAEITRALETPGLLDAALARRLAQVSLAHGLGLEERILKGAGQGTANTLDRALLLESRGQRDQALALLEQNLKDAAPAAAPEAATQRAQFLDLVADPGALAAWKSALAAAPDSLPVILAALRSRSVPTDQAMVESLAARLIALGGSEADRPAPDVRLARARAILARTPDLRGRDEAVGLLRALVIEAPGRADIREALVDAFLYSNPANGVKPDPRAAMEQLTAAADTATDRGPFTLRLAQIQVSSGARSEAIDTLRALSTDNATTPQSRLRAVDALSGLGASDPALRGLGPLRQRDPSDPELLFREATLLARLGRARESLDAYKRLSATPIANAGMIVSAAIDLRLLGQPDAADAMLAKLENPSIPPVLRELGRGEYLAGGPNPEAAAEHYTQAIALDPKQPRPYLAAVRYHRARKDAKSAEAAARQGLAAVPGNAELEVLLQQILLSTDKSEQPDLTPLADALAKNPATARRAQALRAVDQAQKSGSLKDPAALARLGTEFPDDPTTVVFCAKALLSMGPAQLPRAANILATAAPLSPEDPDLQEFAARCLIDTGRGTPALESAERWRRLTGSPNATIAAAEARLLVGQPDEAATLLRPLPPPKADDTDNTAFTLRRTLARTLVAQGQTSRALDLLRPMIAASARTRTQIAAPLAIESVPTAEEAAAWLTLIAGSTPPDADAEQLPLARAWRQAATRFPSQADAFLRRGLAITQTLTSAEKTATAPAFTLHAALLQATGDRDGAIAAAQKARSLAPDKPEPLVALANAQLARAADPASRKDAIAHASEAAAELAKMAKDDPGLLLMAAGLFEALGDNAAATASYERTLTLTSGSSTAVRAVALNNLAFALATGGRAAPPAAALDRARAMADEAVTIDPRVDYLETLGYIESLRNDRDRAAAAYRRAVQLASPSKPPAAIAGLASVLAGGDNRQRAEATELIRTLDGDPALSAQLSPIRKAGVEAARRTLGLPGK